MTPRIHTSEPAFRPHMSQWQRDKASGVIHPLTDDGTPLWHGIVAGLMLVAAIVAAIGWAS